MHRTKWVSTAQRLTRWVLLLASITGVIFLLLVFAGAFHRKVAREIPSDASEMFTLPAGSQTVSVALKSYPRYESAVGTIQPIHRSEIASKILARVIELNIKAGQQISEGEVLVRLSDDELQARVQQVEADFEAATAQRKLAQIEADRAAQLIASRSISQADFDAAQTRVQTTQAALDRTHRSLEETKVYLSYATIVAPFSGIVIDKTVEAGDTVGPGQPLLTIYDPTHMQLVANVRESLALKLRVGQQLPARLEALDLECLATISEVVPRANIASRSFEVKVTGPCPEGVYSGMFGRLLLPLGEEQILQVPAAAIHRVGQLTFVEVVSSRGLSRRLVQFGRTMTDGVEVLSGLQDGEQVLLRQPASTGEVQ